MTETQPRDFSKVTQRLTAETRSYTNYDFLEPIEKEVYVSALIQVCETLCQINPALSAGGSVNMPLEQAFFGIFGSLTDKFGTKWMLEFDEPQQ